MFESISLTVALIGSAVGGMYDLKTSDMPDIVPYAMISIALVVHGVNSYLAWSYWPLLNSMVVGLGLLGFGYIMYFLGQWGGGDAWMLSAIGFLLPSLDKNLLFPFPFSYLFNVFLVGAVYMLVYAFVFTLMNRKIIFHFKKDMKASSKVLAIGSVALFFMLFIFNWFLMQRFQLNFDLTLSLANSILILLATIGLFVIYKFAKAVEDFGFKKRIHASKLKVGDVLLENRIFEGITEKELKRIRKRKRYVWIKSGVRFAPTFPLALLFTIYFGDGLFLFLKFLY